MHKRDLANGFLLVAVFALSTFIYLSGNEGPQGVGTVLGESTVADADGSHFALFIAGLISKRSSYGDTNCGFVVSEEMQGRGSNWEGELIWSNSEDYKLFLEDNKRIFSVTRGSIYEVEESGVKESLGRIDDQGTGRAKFFEIRNYIFEDFLGEVAQHPTESSLSGEEKIDGVRYYILDNKLSLSNPSREIARKIWVSEEGIFLKAEIEDKTDDYEVYDSTGAAVQEDGLVKHIDIEVKNRVFY